MGGKVMNNMNVNNILTNRIITTGVPKVANKNVQATKNTEFGKIFENELKSCNNLKFSKHAQQRLNARNIIIDSTQIQKISDAVTKAEKKGIKDTLILMDNTAFVASVKNRTIITAVQNEELKDNIFTNIDGAIII